jgi:hypothetical protein
MDVLCVTLAVGLLSLSFLPQMGATSEDAVVAPGRTLGVFLGNVSEGAVVTKQVRLRNDGRDPIRVEGVVSSCGCTGASVPRGSDILPGDDVPIDVSINTKDRKGLQRFRVSVSIKGSPPATVVLSANIKKG